MMALGFIEGFLGRPIGRFQRGQNSMEQEVSCQEGNQPAWKGGHCHRWLRTEVIYGGGVERDQRILAGWSDDGKSPRRRVYTTFDIVRWPFFVTFQPTHANHDSPQQPFVPFGFL